MKIKWSCYRYASESFRCSVDGRALILDDPSHFGYMVITGRAKEAEDEIKRIVRRSWHEPRLVTIGFRSADNPNRFFFTRSLSASADSLSEKLDAYREWKSYLEKRGGIVETYRVAEGSVAPGGNGQPTIKTVTERADLTRPITVAL